MLQTRLFRRLIKLARSAGLGLAMLAMFLVVGSLGPARDDQVALAKGGKNECAQHSGNTRPGKGHGDKNHVHTGPPGQGCRTETTETTTEITTETTSNRDHIKKENQQSGTPNWDSEQLRQGRPQYGTPRHP